MATTSQTVEPKNSWNERKTWGPFVEFMIPLFAKYH
jgi:hypothetical protein